ncbi:MAG: 3-isopropylmalate dehydratase large subunit [Nitrospirae bacterium]|nr:3-isopropylmalate dehydratase large subunit [Nitrospirota bacterium]
MGYTITEKLFSRVSGRPNVISGDIITFTPDWSMANDATAHISIDLYRSEYGKECVKLPERSVLIIDHNVPADSPSTAWVHKKMRNFAIEQGMLLYDAKGICHQIMIENHVAAGQIIVGCDSHSCTYGAIGAFGGGIGCTDIVYLWKTGELWWYVPESICIELIGGVKEPVTARDVILAIIGQLGPDAAIGRVMEFTGVGVHNMSIPERIVLCNMAVEGGAVCGIVEPDEKVISFLPGRPHQFFKSDADARYYSSYSINLNGLDPMIACPHSMENIVPVSRVEGLSINQAFIGSCNNGRIEDLRAAAKVLKGNKVKKAVRLVISPASINIYRQALQEGLIDIFLEAGAQVLNPSCSTCWGGCTGLVGDGERLISTGTRNFKGRSGSHKSEIYLASAITTAVSAIEGVITCPVKE